MNEPIIKFENVNIFDFYDFIKTQNKIQTGFISYTNTQSNKLSIIIIYDVLLKITYLFPGGVEHIKSINDIPELIKYVREGYNENLIN